VLALQRSIGNAATRRLLLRTPRKPYEHQWENPALVETIYPARETMLKKFVSIYREIELGDLTDPAERQKAVERTRAAMQQEVDRLKALPEPTPEELARVKELEATLAKGAASEARAWEDAVRWERDHGADALAGDALMAEVRRLFGTKGVPDWLEPLVLDYAGMRYASAHASYYSPVRLLHFVEHAPSDMSPEDAIARLEALHDAGEIPEWAWHKIVRLTELRTYYADEGWEDKAAEVPGGGPDDARWISALASWTDGDVKVKGLSRGVTGWRSEVRSRNVVLTTRMVCDQLSEVTQRQRGIELPGGISKNAGKFVRAALGGNGSKPVPGAVFKQSPAFEDLKPGAVLFWINDTKWATKKPDPSNMVFALPGISDYPMPPPPEYVADWLAWERGEAGKAWKRAERDYKRELKAYEKKVKKAKKAAAKAKTTFDPASVGDAPVKPASTQPRYVEGELLPSDRDSNGFTYTVSVGDPITRTDGKVTHWLTWRHQATVLKAMSRSRVITWETTDALPGKDKLSVSGFRERTAESLAEPGVFVGYMPGTVDPVEPEADDAALPLPDMVEELFKTMLDSW
jgi:hypothetical protein